MSRASATAAKTVKTFSSSLSVRLGPVGRLFERRREWGGGECVGIRSPSHIRQEISAGARSIAGHAGGAD